MCFETNSVIVRVVAVGCRNTEHAMHIDGTFPLVVIVAHLYILCRQPHLLFPQRCTYEPHVERYLGPQLRLHLHIYNYGVVHGKDGHISCFLQNVMWIP